MLRDVSVAEANEVRAAIGHLSWGDAAEASTLALFDELAVVDGQHRLSAQEWSDGAAAGLDAERFLVATGLGGGDIGRVLGVAARAALTHLTAAPPPPVIRYRDRWLGLATGPDELQITAYEPSIAVVPREDGRSAVLSFVPVEVGVEDGKLRLDLIPEGRPGTTLRVAAALAGASDVLVDDDSVVAPLDDPISVTGGRPVTVVPVDDVLLFVQPVAREAVARKEPRKPILVPSLRLMRSTGISVVFAEEDEAALVDAVAALEQLGAEQVVAVRRGGSGGLVLDLVAEVPSEVSDDALTRAVECGRRGVAFVNRRDGRNDTAWEVHVHGADQRGVLRVVWACIREVGGTACHLDGAVASSSRPSDDDLDIVAIAFLPRDAEPEKLAVTIRAKVPWCHVEVRPVTGSSADSPTTEPVDHPGETDLIVVRGVHADVEVDDILANVVKLGFDLRGSSIRAREDRWAGAFALAAAPQVADLVERIEMMSGVELMSSLHHHLQPPPAAVREPNVFLMESEQGPDRMIPALRELLEIGCDIDLLDTRRPDLMQITCSSQKLTMMWERETTTLRHIMEKHHVELRLDTSAPRRRQLGLAPSATFLGTTSLSQRLGR
ncbi:MAG TPA: hypothetical protein VF228_25910 [Iamia sp.]